MALWWGGDPSVSAQETPSHGTKGPAEGCTSCLSYTQGPGASLSPYMHCVLTAGTHAQCFHHHPKFAQDLERSLPCSCFLQQSRPQAVVFLQTWGFWDILCDCLRLCSFKDLEDILISRGFRRIIESSWILSPIYFIFSP